MVRVLYTCDERPVLSNQQFEVLAFFVGKLQENPLALRVFKSLTLALEELVGIPLALNPNHERFPIIDDPSQFLCT